MTKLWHYTTGHHWEQIQKDGFIKTTPKQPGPGEVAAVWYSSNQLWEPTAAKKICDAQTGAVLGITPPWYLAEVQGGLVRIAWGGDERHLWTWQEFCLRAPEQSLKLALNCMLMHEELHWEEPGSPEDWHMIPMVVHRMLWGEVQKWDGKEWR